MKGGGCWKYSSSRWQCYTEDHPVIGSFDTNTHVFSFDTGPRIVVLTVQHCQDKPWASVWCGGSVIHRTVPTIGTGDTSVVVLYTDQWCMYNTDQCLLLATPSVDATSFSPFL